MTKILVVDDDQEMTRMLDKYLSNEGYQVTVASTGVAALSAASATEPQLVLLDIVLGAEDGREILRDLRSISDVPVIFLTGRGLETERIAGLKLGADDYIVKPFSLGEVSARIETILRRAGVNTAQHAIERPDISFGDLQINENTHEVRLAGQLLDLTSKEFSLLSFIATTPRQVYTRSQLLEHVWASSSEWQNEATVTEHIRRLRAKIETDPDHPKWIKTVRGVGYRFEPQLN
ncbi:MAG TPA: response regulator transcription factor [Acidimicrobiales bacterium]|nr:response regulator transcription factor [Acidimicrobiales bacterium]